MKAGVDAAWVGAAASRACARIAPTWPLDRFIAVNPYWGFVDRPLPQVAARLSSLSGTRLLMPRSFYREQWRSGELNAIHLQAAIDAAGAAVSVEQLIASLDQPATAPAPVPRVTDLLDRKRDLRHSMPWREFVTHNISQCCAAWFDQGQASWHPDRETGLYNAWLHQSAHDLTPRLLMGFKAFGPRAEQLPEDPLASIATVVDMFGIPEAACEDYFTALLLDVNGWASWCAYQRWQARLGQRDDVRADEDGTGGDALLQLLAIRLAWEALLLDPQADPGTAQALVAGWCAAGQAARAIEAHEQHGWLWQDALERAWQAPLIAALGTRRQPDSSEAAHSGGASAASSPARAAVQAVFCIDVRSEVFRRALEGVAAGGVAGHDAIQTLGFAGFFGVPAAYNPIGTPLQRPQLPGLLAPAMTVTEVCDLPPAAAQLSAQRQQALQWRQRWHDFRVTAGSAFSFVETCGLPYAAKLLMRSLPGRGSAQPVEQAGVPATLRHRLRPRLQAAHGATAAEYLQARTALAAGVLHKMGLTGGLARLVLLAGHGSQTENNPHAAGLDCGACGGQTGEVNARVLAALLNDAAVRGGLAERGQALPADTWFVAGLHNTTTDGLALFDLDQAPASHAADIAQLRTWLARAGDRARTARAQALGLAAHASDAPALARAFQQRACDWAQVRPEWGLAGNAGFVVAPRARTRHLDLGGRSFLHDYDWRSDEDGSTLELIMTAPMLVTHWINMQYYASTVDNRRYGSGNKVLHNVVGGRLGVFEGNGGDLRIGLPWQSLHDGELLRHVPLRLSVFIEAPQRAIDQVLERHPAVRQLLDHRWVHLFRIEPHGQGVWRYRGDDWVPAGAGDAEGGATAAGTATA
jgi:uncharacterized protein YbcC (UPF0753/DUF2309 family)